MGKLAETNLQLIQMENNVFSIFNKFPGLLIAFSTKEQGNLRIKLSGSLEIDRAAKLDREKFLKEINVGNESLVGAILEHGSKVVAVARRDSGKNIDNTDGLITDERGIFLCLTVADCLPIFLYDPNKKVVALVHAGWRGLERGVVENAIDKFRTGYGSTPSDLIAAIGPSICTAHYEIKEDVAKKFADYEEALLKKDSRIFLDLQLIAKTKLVKCGLKEINIEIADECTFELPEKYFSFRRDKPETVEAMLAVFGMK
jgi:hypothetical protein